MKSGRTIEPADLACAESCVAIYNYPGHPLVSWDHVDEGNDDGVYWTLLRLTPLGTPVARWRLVFRGSVTRGDWLRNLMTVANPFDHSELGPIHPGFFLGLTRVFKEVFSIIGPVDDLEVTGHSLGAGRASQFAGMMVAVGRPPARLVAIAEPKPGFARLSKLLCNIPGVTVLNGSPTSNKCDPVPSLPFELLIERFEHSREETSVFTVLPPGAARPWGDLVPWKVDYHHAVYYAEAMRRAAAGNDTGVTPP